MKYKIFILILVVYGCKQSAESRQESPIKEHDLQAVLWQQRSSEYRALCYQAYNISKSRLDILLEEHKNSQKPLAIITDIDETVLDNSFFNAKLIETDKEYNEEKWFEWVKEEKAIPIPGALEFFKYAESMNVTVFYISNRNIQQIDATISNLKTLGFPFVDLNHLLLKDSTSKKQSRRDAVLKENNVILYLGDNLSDFSTLFEGQDRHDFIDSVKSKFGFEFIVFPNPMYGDWETKEIYEGRYNWTSFQKDSIRKVKLISY